MNCHRVQNLISAYVDGEVPGLEMLVIRRHLSDCPECNFEFESLLSVKRAFGGLQPEYPADGLTDRIFAQLDQIPPPAYERVLAALRGYLTVYPSRLRLAGVGVGLFAVLLMLRAGELSVNNYTNIPTSEPAVVAMAEEAPVPLLQISSVVEAGSLGVPKPAERPWGLAEEPVNPGAFVESTNLLPTGY